MAVGGQGGAVVVGHVEDGAGAAGEVGGGCAGGSYVEEDLGGGLDADPRHAHQDRGEREVLQHGLDLPRHGRPLFF